MGQSQEQGAKSFKRLSMGMLRSLFWANSDFKEKHKSNKAFEEIEINKEVQKSINIIMAIDGNNLHDFGI